MKKNKILLLISVFSLLFNCSVFNKSTEDQKEKQIVKKRVNPNASERAEAARDKGLVLFGKKIGENNGTISFSSSNVLWRASLEVLEFLPLETVDYNGGVISSDWYKNNQKSNEEIKIRVQFTSDELSPSSLKVISHKRICTQNTGCNITKTNSKIISEIKKTIIAKARDIKIANEKK